MTALQDIPDSLASGGAGANWRVLAPVFVVVSIDAMGNGVILPLLPFYSERMGATPLMLGALIAAYWLAQLIAAPVLGAVSDRIGRKPVLVISQIGTLAGFVTLALASTLPFVFLGRVIDGLTSGNLSVASAYAIDRSGRAGRRQAIGVISAAIGLGTMIGPALSGLLAQISLSAPIWVAAMLSFGSVIATMLLLPSNNRKRAVEPVTSALPGVPSLSNVTLALRPGARSSLMMLALYYLSFGMFMSQFALFAAGRLEWTGIAFGPREVGIAFTVAGAINIFVQFVLLRPLGHVLSDRGLATLCFAVIAVGYLGLGIGNDVLTWGPAILLISFGAALARPSLVAAFSREMPHDRQGAAMGVNQSLIALANIVAALLAGFIIDQGWYAGWSVTLSAIATAGAAAAIWRGWPDTDEAAP